MYNNKNISKRWYFKVTRYWVTGFLIILSLKDTQFYTQSFFNHK